MSQILDRPFHPVKEKDEACEGCVLTSAPVATTQHPFFLHSFTTIMPFSRGQTQEQVWDPVAEHTEEQTPEQPFELTE